VRIFGARIPDVVGPVRTATAALVCLSVGLAVMAAWQVPLGLYVGTAVFAGGSSLLFPALNVLVIDAAPATERSSAVATFSIFFDLSQGVGALVLGVVVAVGGEPSAFAVGAVLCLVALVVLRRRAPGPRGRHRCRSLGNEVSSRRPCRAPDRRARRGHRRQDGRPTTRRRAGRRPPRAERTFLEAELEEEGQGTADVGPGGMPRWAITAAPSRSGRIALTSSAASSSLMRASNASMRLDSSSARRLLRVVQSHLVSSFSSPRSGPASRTYLRTALSVQPIL
jgi:hypothetical protein